MKPAPTETASGYLPRIRFVRLALSMTGWLTCFLTLSCGRQEAGTSERMEGARNAQTFESANDHNTKAETDQLGPGAELPRYELEMATSDFEGMENNSFSNDTRPATFKAGGKSYKGVKVRVRGAWSRSWPKKSLKIIFNKGAAYDGHSSLNLNSGWRDPAFVREPLAYHIYATCGVPAPRSRMVRLDVNGHFNGLYVEVEQPDKAFLSRVGLEGATVFKAGSRGRDSDERDLGSEEAYAASYKRQTQKSNGYDDLQQFCHGLETATDTISFLTRNVDLERYINYLAATALIQHWDGFNKNHFLIYDSRGSRKWLVVPWDLDRTLGDHWNGSFTETSLPLLLGTRGLPGVTGWNRLEEKFCNEPKLRRRLLDRLNELLANEFTREKLDPLLDKMEKEILADAVRDRSKWPSAASDVHEEIAQVKRFIEKRRTFLRREIERLRDGR